MWVKGKPRGVDAPAVFLRAIAVASKQRAFSIRKLARRIGVSDRTVRRWIAGAKRPSAGNLEALSHALPEILRALEQQGLEFGHPTGCSEYTLRMARADLGNMVEFRTGPCARPIVRHQL